MVEWHESSGLEVVLKRICLPDKIVRSLLIMNYVSLRKCIFRALLSRFWAFKYLLMGILWLTTMRIGLNFRSIDAIDQLLCYSVSFYSKRGRSSIAKFGTSGMRWQAISKLNCLSCNSRYSNLCASKLQSCYCHCTTLTLCLANDHFPWRQWPGNQQTGLDCSFVVRLVMMQTLDQILQYNHQLTLQISTRIESTDWSYNDTIRYQMSVVSVQCEAQKLKSENVRWDLRAKSTTVSQLGLNQQKPCQHQDSSKTNSLSVYT